MDTKTIGFFLPTFNNLEELKKAIHSILHLNVPFVVGVDGSNDGTIEWLEEKKYTFLNHPNRNNLGRAMTRNLALQLDWDWIIFMDSDLEFIGSLDELLNHSSNTQILIGNIHYKFKETNPWIDYCSTRGIHKTTSKFVSFESFTTGICAIPGQLFQHLNGFDKNFTHYGGEDLEFAIRANQHHFKFIKSKLLKTTSEDKKEMAHALNQLKEFGSKGLRYMLKKHPNLPLYRIESKIPTLFEPIIRKLTNHAPIFIRRKLIHYLVYCNVKNGYYSNNT